MKLLIDTSAYSALCRGDRAIAECLSQAEAVGVSPIVLGELYSGFRRGKRWKSNVVDLDEFLAEPRSLLLSISVDTSRYYAEIDAYLREKGRPIPRNDVWIAASAMEHGMHVLTLDRHFREIPLLLLAP